MKMRSEIVMQADPQRIYSFASQTLRWPDFLPHYRYVRLLWADDESREVEMAARRGPIPVRWRARQTNNPHVPEIRFKHTWGWTRGMHVVWRFERAGASTRVIIEHDLLSPIAPIAAYFFIHPIAARTLRCVKALAEAAD